ncbi:hypothetical protein ACOMHN_006508 [Nucella lapillus]
MGEPVQNLTHVKGSKGSKLAYIIYPESILQDKIGPFLSVMFFLALASFGITSQIAGANVLTTALLDLYPQLTRRRYLPLLAFCLLGFLWAFPFTVKRVKALLVPNSGWTRNPVKVRHLSTDGSSHQDTTTTSKSTDCSSARGGSLLSVHTLTLIVAAPRGSDKPRGSQGILKDSSSQRGSHRIRHSSAGSMSVEGSAADPTWSGAGSGGRESGERS